MSGPAYYAANRERVKERVREYRRANRAHLRETSRAYREANRENETRRKAAWRKANLEHSREMKRLDASRRRARLRNVPTSNYTLQDVIDLYGKQCYLCGGSLSDGWHVEHVIPLAKGGWNLISNVRPSCVPCNLRKGAKIPPAIRQMKVWYDLSTHLDWNVVNA